MPTSTLPPDTRDEQDQAYNPEEQRYERTFNRAPGQAARDLKDRENQAGIHAGGTSSTATSGGGASSIDNTREQEQAGGNTPPPGRWANNTSGNAEGPDSPAGKYNAKRRKGPIAFLLGIIAAFGAITTVLFTPGALLVNLKEVYAEKFNDQLAAMDVRTTALIKKKFKGTTSGLCTTKLSIRCKYETMSNRQLKKLEKAFTDAGGKVNSEKTRIPGRNKIISFEYKGKVITAQNFSAEARNDPGFRSTMLYGYNPKLAGFADHVFTKLARKLGFNKQANATGDTDEERRKSVLDAANGTAIAEADVKVSSNEEDCNGGEGCVDGKRTVYRDETTGREITKEQYDQRINGSTALQAEFEQRRTLAEAGESVGKATLKGALTVTALGLGAVDSACTGYVLIRAVGFAAKYLGMLQLIRFAQVFMNTADRIKASGTEKDPAQALQPEDVEYAGKIITAVNSEGKSGTDSYGYHYTAYGDVNPMPRTDNISAESVGEGGNNVQLSEEEKQRILINDETTKYINGQLVSDNLLTDVIELVGETGSVDEIDDFCGFVKSGWGQAIVIGASLVGAVVAFFSGGLSVGWGTAAQVAVSVSLSVAMAMLTPKLVGMASGTLIGDDELTNGNRAINAVTSGMGGLNHETSQARAVPALQKDDVELVGYQNLTKDTLSQYAAVERLNLSPLDPSSPHTFIGSLVSRLIPYTSKFSTVTGGMTGLMQFTTSSFASLLPNAHAQDPMAQFNVCQDIDYTQLNLAADPFCNIRHGLNNETLAIDPDMAAAYMERNGYVNEETGEPKDSENEYAKYIQNCIDRSVALGAYTEDNDNKGEECIQGSASKNPSRDANCSSGSADDNEECKRNMFRLYYLDVSIDTGMTEGEVASNAGTKPTAVSGDAKALAEQVAQNQNIVFANPETKEQLLKFSRGEEVFSPCNEPMTVSKYLLGALQTNSTKYRILVSDIGFREDRSGVGCERGAKQHPKGTAVDLDDITIIGGASTGGNINLPGSGLAVVNQYATDFLAALPLNRGGVGQKNCGVNPTFPQGSVALNGTHLFDDTCNHFHIDARNRENLMDTE